MSIEIRAKIICDGCGVFIEGAVGRRTSAAWESHESAQDEAIRAEWITTDHGRFYPRRHFCPPCQDKPMPKLKRLERRKRGGAPGE